MSSPETLVIVSASVSRVSATLASERFATKRYRSGSSTEFRKNLPRMTGLPLTALTQLSALNAFAPRGRCPSLAWTTDSEVSGRSSRPITFKYSLAFVAYSYRGVSVPSLATSASPNFICGELSGVQYVKYCIIHRGRSPPVRRRQAARMPLAATRPRREVGPYYPSTRRQRRRYRREIVALLFYMPFFRRNDASSKQPICRYAQRRVGAGTMRAP